MNGFKENVKNAFSSLKKDPEFTDVTLACEDGNQVEVHKVVLAASSPYFCNLLKRNKHSHPLIYMTGLQFPDLLALVDFFYYGEANILHENLDTFLNISNKLDLKGFNDKEEEFDNEEGEEKMHSKQTHTAATINLKTEAETQIGKYESETVIALSTYAFSGDLKELDEKIKTVMGRGENMVRNGAKQMTRAYLCKVCGKEGILTNIRNHIEAMHIEGIMIPCDHCGKTFKTRNGIRAHTLVHKEKQPFLFC